MSSWLRWVNNAAANFNLSQSIRAASGRFMDRNRKHMRKKCDKPDQHVESCQSSKSVVNNSNCTSCACACSSTTSCTTCGRSSCATTASCTKSCASAKCNHIPDHHDGCTCSLCTDYAEYIRATKGEDTSARVWASDEPRFVKQANADATSSVEYRTGIPTGTAI